jgi:hypothetical protein
MLKWRKWLAYLIGLVNKLNWTLLLWSAIGCLMLARMRSFLVSIMAAEKHTQSHTRIQSQLCRIIHQWVHVHRKIIIIKKSNKSYEGVKSWVGKDSAFGKDMQTSYPVIAKVEK